VRKKNESTRNCSVKAPGHHQRTYEKRGGEERTRKIKKPGFGTGGKNRRVKNGILRKTLQTGCTLRVMEEKVRPYLGEGTDRRNIGGGRDGHLERRRKEATLS